MEWILPSPLWRPLARMSMNGFFQSPIIMAPPTQTSALTDKLTRTARGDPGPKTNLMPPVHVLDVFLPV